VLVDWSGSEDLGQLGQLQQPVGILTVDDAVDEVVCFAGLAPQRGNGGAAIINHGGLV
jgi:hypothetical protein